LLAYEKSLAFLKAVRDAQIRDAKLRDEALRAAKGTCLNIAEAGDATAEAAAVVVGLGNVMYLMLAALLR
jgi:hypothetical protein